MVATAIIGSAVIGAAGSAYASDQAADAQADAAREAGDIEREMFYQTRADYAPYREVGASALNRLGALYGVSQDGVSTPDYSEFYASPDYKFAYDEGLRATEQSIARRGLQGSGAERKALTRFGQGLASQQLGNYKNSLAALAGIGQTSTSQLGALGANTAGNLAQGAMAAGEARASSYLNQGAAFTGAANDISLYYAMNNAGMFGGKRGKRG